MSTLSELIRDKRTLFGLSLRDFSEKCGLSHTYIKNLEESDPRTGKAVVPTVESLDKICKALEMPLDTLLKEIGYIDDDKLRFEPSNLRLVRGNKSYKQITKEIYQKTDIEIDPVVYEDIESGNDENPSIIFVDILAKYVGVEREFFFRKNSEKDLRHALIYAPYKKATDSSDRKSIYHIKENNLYDFISDPQNIEYIKFAKELSEKKLKVSILRDMLFRD